MSFPPGYIKKMEQEALDKGPWWKRLINNHLQAKFQKRIYDEFAHTMADYYIKNIPTTEIQKGRYTREVGVFRALAIIKEHEMLKMLTQETTHDHHESQKIADASRIPRRYKKS